MGKRVMSLLVAVGVMGTTASVGCGDDGPSGSGVTESGDTSGSGGDEDPSGSGVTGSGGDTTTDSNTTSGSILYGCCVFAVHYTCSSESAAMDCASSNKADLSACQPDAESCGAPAEPLLTWDDANTYCSVLGLAGGGWTLPTLDQLKTLLLATAEPDGCYINSCAFPNSCKGPGEGIECDPADRWVVDPQRETVKDTMTGLTWQHGSTADSDDWPGPRAFWSSTSLNSDPSMAWYVEFASGDAYTNGKSSHSYVRCVRS